jgi:hypothetical protein
MRKAFAMMLVLEQCGGLQESTEPEAMTPVEPGSLDSDLSSQWICNAPGVPPQQFVEPCAPYPDAWWSMHTFPGLSNLDIKARVSVLCVKSNPALPNFPFEVEDRFTVENSTVRAVCGYQGFGGGPICSQVIFFLKGR